jgi:hypothetical protein
MARKASSGKVYSVVKGADGKFKSVSRGGKSSKAPAVRKPKASKPAATKPMAAKKKRTATPKQLAALANARAARKLKGKSSGTTALGGAVSSLVDPYAGVKKGVNPYAPYLAYDEPESGTRD